MCKIRTAESLNILGRNRITLVTWIKVYIKFRKCLHMVELFNPEPLCRLRWEEEKTVSYILSDCVARGDYITTKTSKILDAVRRGGFTY